VKRVGFLNEPRLSRKHHRELTVCGLTPRCRRAIVLLQDRAQHIGEAVDGCQTSLTIMYFVMHPDMSQMYLYFLMLHACFYTICLVFRYTSWRFYAFSGTNLLTRCHSDSSLFSAAFVFQKSYT
jgi:hypothetical protein